MSFPPQERRLEVAQQVGGWAKVDTWGVSMWGCGDVGMCGFFVADTLACLLACLCDGLIVWMGGWGVIKACYGEG